MSATEERTVAHPATRLFSAVIDHVIVFAILFIAIQVSKPLHGVGLGFFTEEFVSFYGVNWAAWVVYFAVLEAKSGRTPGKRLLGLEVRRDDGGEIAGRAAVVRNVLRVVDALPFLYFLGGLLVVLQDSRKRLGDMAAGTVVVEA